MLEDFLNNLSIFLSIDPTIIPNMITLAVVIIIIFLTFKAQIDGIASVAVLLAMYTVSMTILSLLGIDSVFNMITLIGDLL